jgi:hypothetical protein
MSSAYPPNQRGEEHYSYTQWAGDHEQPQAYSTPHTYSAHTQQYQYAYPQVDYSHGGDLGTGTGNGGGPSGLEVQKPAAGYSSSDVSVKEDEDVPAENEKLPSSSPPLNYVPKIEFPPEYTEEDKHKEAEFMQNGLVNWDDVKNWRTWIRKEWWRE